MTRDDASSAERPWLPAVLVLACIALALAPMAIRGTTCGQDFDFHFESWMGVVRQWRQGILYPHWIASANYGAGEPRFVFYPPVSWELGAILCVLLPWSWAQFTFALITLLAMGAACYRMAREWLPFVTSALAAGLYVANPYILFVIYERSALAEFLAAAWLPLLFLYALRKKRSTIQLAVVVALLWLTDPPAAVMGSYALALVVSISAISQRSLDLVARAAAATALGLGLTGFYLIPAIYEQRWVEISRALSIGMRVQDSFLFEHTGMVYHDQVLRSVSWIAVTLLIVTFVAITTLIASRNPGAPLKRGVRLKGFTGEFTSPLRLPLFILSFAITLSLFHISLPIWYTLPKLRYLQFPWRWLLVLGLIAALFTAEALVTLFARIIPDRQRAASTPGTRTARPGHYFPCLILPAAAVLAIAAIAAMHAYRYYWQFCDDQDNVHAQRLALTNPGFEGTDEYTPTPADNSSIQVGLPPVRVVATATSDQADDEPSANSASNDSSSSDDDDTGNPTWQPAPHVLLPATITIHLWHEEHIVTSIRSPQPAFAVFRLMDYPAWRIRINQKLAPLLPQRPDGLLTIAIPAGTSTIDIRYGATPDMWAGRIVSLIALTLWLALAAKTWRRRGMMEQNASRTPA